MKRLVYLDHALDVLEQLARAGEGTSLSALARQVDVSKSGVFRILGTLQTRAYVEKHSGAYRIGPTVLELGLAVPQRQLLTAASPAMDAVTRATRESTFLSVLDRFWNVTIHTVEPSQIVRVHLDVGARIPANCSVSGLAMLAFLPLDELMEILPAKLEKGAPATIADRKVLMRELKKIRQNGRAMAIGPWRPDAGGSAAPIFDRHGRVVAAFGVAAPASRLSKERLLELADHVTSAATTISRMLGYIPNTKNERHDSVARTTSNTAQQPRGKTLKPQMNTRRAKAKSGSLNLPAKL